MSQCHSEGIVDMKSGSHQAKQLILVLGAGLLGASGGYFVGLPLPFLLGSLLMTALFSLIFYSKKGELLWYPLQLRQAFIAVIGAMIGTTFSPDVLSLATSLPITLGAMALFVILAQSLNYVVFRQVGRYDKLTAFYSAMPGGLIEAITLGEKAGVDVDTLSVQHFVRIILVIVFVPALFLFFTGQAVGSAAGHSVQVTSSDWTDWVFIIVMAAAGKFIGEKVRLPAPPLIGPMILTAAFHAFNVIDVQGPVILLNAAQLIVGAGLGTAFAGLTVSRLAAAIGLGIISVSMTLGLAALFALALTRLVPIPFGALLISFAPGGVTEMSLVALSLGVSPVLVTAHHLFRIVFAVAVASTLNEKSKPLKG